MASKKSASATEIKETVKQEALPIPQTPANAKYKRTGAVSVPSLKVAENVPVFVHVNGAIFEKQSPIKGDDGVMVMKTLEIMTVTNLETGEIMSMVCGKALSQNLKDYKGGNQAYVGLDFEITKHSAAAGKRWKPYSIFEIAAK